MAIKNNTFEASKMQGLIHIFNLLIVNKHKAIHDYCLLTNLTPDQFLNKLSQPLAKQNLNSDITVQNHTSERQPISNYSINTR